MRTPQSSRSPPQSRLNYTPSRLGSPSTTPSATASTDNSANTPLLTHVSGATVFTPLPRAHSAVDLNPSAVEYTQIASSPTTENTFDSDSVNGATAESFRRTQKSQRWHYNCRAGCVLVYLSVFAATGLLAWTLYQTYYLKKWASNPPHRHQGHQHHEKNGREGISVSDWLSGRFRPESISLFWAHDVADGNARASDAVYVVDGLSILIGPASELPSLKNFSSLLNLEDAAPPNTHSNPNDIDHERAKRAENSGPPIKLYPTLLENFSVSKDETFVLFATKPDSSWRQTSKAVHYIYNVNLSAFFALAGGKPIHFAEWSPVGHALAYVDINNNLWVAKHNSSAPGGWTEFAVASDASDAVRYGRADWVYEEDMFESPRALYWAPDARHLAFLRFDDTKVPVYELLRYFESPYADRISSYPKSQPLHYPKPESNNPIVTLHLISIMELGLRSALQLKAVAASPLAVKFEHKKYEILGPSTDRIYSGVSWLSGSLLVVRNLNRIQNVAIWSSIKISGESQLTYTAVPFYVERHDSGAWVRSVSPVIPVPSISNSAFATILENNGFMHVGILDASASDVPRFVTFSQNWEVETIYGFDAAVNSLLVLASEENSPGTRAVLAVTLGNSDSRKSRRRSKVSAAMRKLIPTLPIGYYDASFSRLYRAVVIKYKGPDIPWERMFYIPQNLENPAKLLKILTSNDNLQKKIAERNFPSVEYRFIELDNGITVYAKFVLPPPLISITQYDADDYDSVPEHYPVHIYVYGGPESQENKKDMKTDFCTVLASSYNIICASFDVRGTAFRGLAYRHAVYQLLGTKEAQDQLAAIRWLRNRRVVDVNKIGIFGWSYGGYMVCRIIESLGTKNDGQKLNLAYAVAVAPVTDWRLYDSFYTERYMGSALGNDEENYIRSAISNKEAFRDIPLLIMQGSHDDNVHVGNMYWLLTLLERAGITNFRFRMYPDSAHSMDFENRFVDVYNTTASFIEETLWKTHNA